VTEIVQETNLVWCGHIKLEVLWTLTQLLCKSFKSHFTLIKGEKKSQQPCLSINYRYFINSKLLIVWIYFLNTNNLKKNHSSSVTPKS